MPILRQVNKQFFKNWSPKMAYVLGLFTADGNMIRNKRGAYFISFELTDADILQKVRSLFKSSQKITSRKRGDKWKTSYRLQIGSKSLFADLIALGLTPNKSKSVNFPKIPLQHLSHFVRGYFDGDGHVTVSTYKRAARKNRLHTTILSGFTSGSEKFIKELHKALKNVTNIRGGTLYYLKGYHLTFSVKDSLALYNFLYTGCKGLFLSRKKEKFEKYFHVGP